MYSVSFNGYTLTDYNPTAQGHFSLSQLLHQFKPVISYCNLKRTIPFHIHFQGQFIENLYYGSPAVLIPYDLVRKIVLLSLSCEYVLKIECRAAVDHYSWWVDYNGAKLPGLLLRALYVRHKVNMNLTQHTPKIHDVIKWKSFPRYWPFVRGIHRLPVNSPHKGQWRGALMFTLIYA